MPKARYRSRRERIDAQPKQNAWKRMPAYRRVLLVVLVLGIVAATFRESLLEFWNSILPPVARVALLDADEAPIPMRGRVDVFEVDRTFFRASPLPKLTSINLEVGSEELVIADKELPTSLQVRFHVPGYGVDYISVERGRRKLHRLRLGAAVEVKGVVTGKAGAPVAGARVLALGGSARGVLLTETKSSTDGSFTLPGISKLVDFLTLRVLKDGYALAEREHWLQASKGEEKSRTDFQLVPVPPVRGEIRLPENVQRKLEDLRITVLKHPGVSANVDERGQFELQHLAPGSQYRLLVQGLPDGFTHRMTYVRPGQAVTLEVVPAVTLHGKVVSERLQRTLEGVQLRHTSSTRGQEFCVTDGYGEFELRNVPVGTVLLEVATPETYFGGSAAEESVEVKPRHAEEPVTIRIR